jgi:toxin ParE1/3/4
MAFEVLLTADAVRDLEEIVEWIAENDSPARSAQVLERIEAAIGGLARFPDRGGHPAELLALGMREYRETSFKPYRIIYRVEGRRVYVYLIADGRRDMQSLLARRLLEG